MSRDRWKRALGVLVLCVATVMGCSGEKLTPEQLAELVPQQVRVVGRQFAWDIVQTGPDGRFGTTDDVVAVNEIVLPVGSRVSFELNSKDVVHGFWIPSLDVRWIMIPGAKLSRELVLTKPGRHKIACSELCGLGHAKMTGWLKVLREDEYHEWVSSRKPLLSQRLGR